MIIRDGARATRTKDRRSVWVGCCTLLPVFIVLITTTALATQEPRFDPPVTSPFEAIHQIDLGDTLSLLAAYYYGDARQWPRIVEANPPLVKAPNRLRPGQNVWIPLPSGWTAPEPYLNWKARIFAKADSAHADRHRRKALLLLLILSNALRPH